MSERNPNIKNQDWIQRSEQSLDGAAQNLHSQTNEYILAQNQKERVELESQSCSFFDLVLFSFVNKVLKVGSDGPYQTSMLFETRDDIKFKHEEERF